MNNIIIYGLIDPLTQELRYVGKSTSGLKRPKQHWNKDHLKLQDWCHNWVRKVVNGGRKPEIAVLEILNKDDDLNDAEDFWIAYYRFLNCRLTNMTNGGKGSPGRILSSETKNKIANSLKGQPSGRKGKGEFSNLVCQNPECGKVFAGKSRSKYHSKECYIAMEKVPGKYEEAKGHCTRTQKVKCLTDGNVFNSLREAACYYNMIHSTVSKSIKSKIPVKGLQFELATKEFIRQIYCVTDELYFNSPADAVKYYGFSSPQSVSNAIRQNTMYKGKKFIFYYKNNKSAI